MPYVLLRLYLVASGEPVLMFGTWDALYVCSSYYIHQTLKSDLLPQIFEFLTGRWLFVPRAGDMWTAEQYHLAHMPGVVGEDFDVSYYKQAKQFHNCFSEDEGP